MHAQVPRNKYLDIIFSIVQTQFLHDLAHADISMTLDIIIYISFSLSHSLCITLPAVHTQHQPSPTKYTPPPSPPPTSQPHMRRQTMSV